MDRQLGIDAGSDDFVIDEHVAAIEENIDLALS